MVRKQFELVENEKENGALSSGNATKNFEEEKTEQDETGEFRVSYTEKEVLESKFESPKMTKQEISARREIYKEAKKKVKILEKTNTSKMFVFRDWRIPWFKAGGKSAIYYAFDVARRGGKKSVNINADRDGYANFYDGIVSFNGTENLFRTMEKAQIEPPKVISDGWILVFDLKHNYDKDELKMMQRAVAERRKEINNIIIPTNIYPLVYNNILTLTKRISPNIFKLGPNQRAAFAEMTMETLVELHKTYLKITNGDLTPMEGAWELMEQVKLEFGEK